MAAARSVLPVDHEALAQPRAEGLRAALRVLLAARRSLNVQRTADRNALTALVRTIDLGIDVRHPLTDAQVSSIASWRTRTSDDTPTAVTRAEAKRLATGILRRTRELTENQRALSTHVNSLAKGLQDINGVGPVTAAIILTAYSHRGRVRSEAAFAALAGVNPIPASSGNTTRHRLNRYGDRQLNRAFDVIARVRMLHDPETRAYVERRTAEGKSRKGSPTLPEAVHRPPDIPTASIDHGLTQTIEGSHKHWTSTWGPNHCSEGLSRPALFGISLGV